MSDNGVISTVVLIAGLLIVVASCIGIAVMDDPMDRLHLVTPAAMLGSVGVCAAVIVHSGLSTSGLAAIVVVTVIVGTSPFTSHAMARSIWVRRRSETDNGRSEDEIPGGAEGSGR